MSETSWENACREVAEEEAKKDALLQWGMEAGETPPFAYRWEHVQQVVAHARWLLTQVEADADVLIAAAWLHDVRKRKSNHAKKGAKFAKKFLKTTDFPANKIEAVAEVIAQHEGLYRPADDWSEASGEPFRPAPPMGPIEVGLLWDADKLTKVGPLALLHYIPFAIAGAMEVDRSLTTEVFYADNERWINEIGPRIIASFNTEVAQRRATRMQAIYEEFQMGLAKAIDLSEEFPA
ncbi:MAG: HD domain-containing protein [Anaerolineales bacterium]|nr:HD domain-containing protein [Anaerolineales bacterium]